MLFRGLRQRASRASALLQLHDAPAFAADSRARLMYFFERSPWYAAQTVGAYPVLRLDAAQLRQLPAPQHSPRRTPRP
ncbi:MULTISPECIES: hypothetical protein [Rhodanobacter]|uniref:hypothetical protein n=1 Tax=Rhodanobacter TaxID=75309 RepID=UPI0004848E23